MNLDGFQARELAQANFEDIFGLPVGQPEGINERRLGFIRFANDPDHCINIEQDLFPSFEDMDAVIYLGQTMLRTPGDGRKAKANPLRDDGAQTFLARPAIAADHHQIDRGAALKRGVRQEQMHEFSLIDILGLRFEHQTHCRLTARFVTHGIERAEQDLLLHELIGRERLFAQLDLWIRQLFNFFQHLLRGRAGWQFSYHCLPLSACQLFDLPACPYFHAAATGFIHFVDRRSRGNDLSSAREIRAGNHGHQFSMR